MKRCGMPGKTKVPCPNPGCGRMLRVKMRRDGKRIATCEQTKGGCGWSGFVHSQRGVCISAAGEGAKQLETTRGERGYARHDQAGGSRNPSASEKEKLTHMTFRIEWGTIRGLRQEAKARKISLSAWVRQILHASLPAGKGHPSTGSGSSAQGTVPPQQQPSQGLPSGPVPTEERRS